MHPGDALFVPGEPVDVLADARRGPVDEDLRGGGLPACGRADARGADPSGRSSTQEARGIYYGRLSEMTDTDFQVLDEENGTEFS